MPVPDPDLLWPSPLRPGVPRTSELCEAARATRRAVAAARLQLREKSAGDAFGAEASEGLQAELHWVDEVVHIVVSLNILKTDRRQQLLWAAVRSVEQRAESIADEPERSLLEWMYRSVRGTKQLDALDTHAEWFRSWRERWEHNIFELVDEAKCRVCSVDTVVLTEKIGMLASEDAAERWHAAAMLRYWAVNAMNNMTMVWLGVLPKFVGIIQEESSGEASRHAIAALGNLALHNKDNPKAIVAAGAVPPLVSLLQSHTERLRLYAARTLWLLSVDGDNTGVIVNSGVVKPLLHVLRIGPMSAWCIAAKLLGNLTVDDGDGRRVVVEHGAVAPLLALLRDGPEGAHEAAAGALRNLAIDAGVSALVAEERLAPSSGLGTIPRLVAMAQSGSVAACGALGNLACDVPANRRGIVEANGVAVLLHSLSSPAMCEEAAGALAHLALDANHARLTVEAGAVAPLADILNASKDQALAPAARLRAASALQNLAAWSPDARRAIAESPGVLPTFARMLVSRSAEARELAAGALANLSHNEPEHLATIFRLKVLPTLEEMQRAEPELAEEAVRALLAPLTELAAQATAAASIARARSISSAALDDPGPYRSTSTTPPSTPPTSPLNRGPTFAVSRMQSKSVSFATTYGSSTSRD